jgi:hypothetical protein
MAISLKRTNGIENSYIRGLLYGNYGAGKTTAIATLPNPLIISAESGLLSIADSDVAYIEVKTLADMYEAYEFITSSDEAKQFESIALDSITEIGDVVLSNEMKNNKDGRQAYVAYGDKMQELIRAYRDISEKHVFFSAQASKIKDDNTGRVEYGPGLPWDKLAQKMPYYFDEVYALRVESDEKGESWRGILTQPDGMWGAKSRAGNLEKWESPDLGAIIKKIQGKEA